MTSFQFDVICKVIESGAPALANELCGALNNFVQAYNTLVEENNKLNAKIISLENPPVDPENTAN